MKFRLKRCAPLVGLIAVSYLLGCAEITIDEMPLDIDDDTPYLPDDETPPDSEDTGDSENKNLDSDDNGSSGIGDEDQQPDSDSEQVTPQDSDSEDISIPDTEPDSEDSGKVAPDSDTADSDVKGHDTQNEIDTDDGGGDNTPPCGSTPLLTSVEPNAQFTLISADEAFGQSFRPLSPNIKAIEIVLSESAVDLGPHTIELVEGEPGELNLIGSWSADVPLDAQKLTSVCLPIGNFTFDQTKIYSITISPHKSTSLFQGLAVIVNDANTYPDGAAWYMDGTGVWYALDFDLYFILY